MFCLNCASDCFFAYIKQTAQAYASFAPKAGVIAGNPCSSLVITNSFELKLIN
jgi:hypothetical protein